MKKTNVLDTGIKFVRNVSRYSYGSGQLSALKGILEPKRADGGPVVFFIDEYFEASGLPDSMTKPESGDLVYYVSTKVEPKTTGVDAYRDRIASDTSITPCAIVGIGGGTTMDTAKAVSNLITNGGNAADYQGWDLVQKPGVFKVLVPTLSGTGAEATRTCVMTNVDNGLKLGMNSDFTVADELILDPDLTKTVSRNQYFYTGMDAYIHCMESLNGSYRNAVGDAFSEQSMALCREVFDADEMMSDENRSRLMVASYLGGAAIAMSYVGVVHPFSAGLSIVLGTHHCIGNCIVMRAMEEFYPEGYKEFWGMVDKQGIEIPSGVCEGLSDADFQRMYDSTVVHSKPLTNALGENYLDILTPERVKELFKSM